MIEVEFELYNIQSHEHTCFILKPGLNFILADDNNVGKSTIFKSIVTLLKMPKVTNEDLTELLRGGTSQGYVALTFGECKVVFWLIRESDKVRSFFEQHIDGTVTRLTYCPDSVREALGIVIGSDNEPINFNDADSIQLVVQDTPKNDEVLAKVLVDLDIERIRANRNFLDKRIQEDYKVLKAKHDDSSSILESLHYNEAVNDFYAEEDFLCAAIRVADVLEAFNVNIDVLRWPITQLSREDALLCDLLNAFESITLSAVNSSITLADIEYLVAILNLISNLFTIDWSLLSEIPKLPTIIVVDNMERANKCLAVLCKASTSLRYLQEYQREYVRLSKECESIILKLKAIAPVVRCPVKGEVYYGDTKCVPTSD